MKKKKDSDPQLYNADTHNAQTSRRTWLTVILSVTAGLALLLVYRLPSPLPYTAIQSLHVNKEHTQPNDNIVETLISSGGMKLSHEFAYVEVDDHHHTRHSTTTTTAHNQIPFIATKKVSKKTRMAMAYRPVTTHESSRRTKNTISELVQQDADLYSTMDEATMHALQQYVNQHNGQLGIKALRVHNKPIQMLANDNDALFEPLKERDDYFKALKEKKSVMNLTLMPDNTDKSTVLSMAIMSSNAYTAHGQNGWVDLDSYNTSISFGIGSKGMAGHVFTSTDDEIVVIAIKGTSPWLPVGADPSWESDRFMDNFMFSCCCARVDVSWRTVCGCYAGYNSEAQTSQCSASCLKDTMPTEDSYYNVARKIYKQVRGLYPNSQIWFTGHSLGGALASLMGATVGAPVFAFESPGEKMYASRLGFKMLPQITNDTPDTYTMAYLPTFHFGNIKDPLFVGQCVGKFSVCYLGGYAMESKCHMANKCMFDTVDDKLDLQFHRIGHVITRLILPADGLPTCKAVRYPTRLSSDGGVPLTGDDEEPLCVDCVDWQFLQ